MTFPDTKIMLRKAMLIKDSLLYLCCIGQLRVCSLKQILTSVTANLEGCIGQLKIENDWHKKYIHPI